MSTGAGVMDMIDLETIVHVPLQCEHSGHPNYPDRHHGDAEWIQFDGPCGCPVGETIGTAFVCDRWRQWVGDLAMRGGNLWCRDCKQTFPAAGMTYTKI